LAEPSEWSEKSVVDVHLSVTRMLVNTHFDGITRTKLVLTWYKVINVEGEIVISILKLPHLVETNRLDIYLSTGVLIPGNRNIDFPILNWGGHTEQWAVMWCGIARFIDRLVGSENPLHFERLSCLVFENNTYLYSITNILFNL